MSETAQTKNKPALYSLMKLAIVCFKFYDETNKMRRRGIFQASVLRDLREDVDKIRKELELNLSPDNVLFSHLGEVEREIESVLVSYLDQ